MAPDDARRAAERAARLSYGKLVALLASRTRDVAAAEDALADAFVAALRTWPERGVPDNPDAWLLTAARRTLMARNRHRKVREEAGPTLQVMAEAAGQAQARDLPDERLGLMLLCAEPAIDPAVQAPLMLQCVLGLSAEQIAASFLVSPGAMAQRLVRAKAQIREARPGFQSVERAQMPERLSPVLSAIYAAYGAAWGDVLGADPRLKGLADEVMWLARLICELLPGNAEAHGLLALTLYCEARRHARRDADGRFVPLAEQDSSRWDAPMIAEAERLLGHAASLRQPGRFQTEAAIQSFHIQRLRSGADRRMALPLYDHLVGQSPTLGALVARAGAMAEADLAETALQALDAIAPTCRDYQPYWATRGAVLLRLGALDEAGHALRRAAGLSDDPSLRDWLLRRVPLTPREAPRPDRGVQP